MGIRIDPTLRVVWRDPQTVQLGVDPVRAVVPVPDLARERFLLTLLTETPREALPAIADQIGCPPNHAAAVLADAADALVDTTEAPVPVVEVLGDGPVVDALCEVLAAERVAVVRNRPRRGGPVLLPDPPPAVAVAVADHVLDPAVRAAWSRRDVPHCAVVIGDGRIRIGPLVEPAAGPCLACAELDRVDEDPAWPVVAPQVWGRPVHAPSPLAIAVVAARTAVDVLGRLPYRTARPTGRQVLVDRDGREVTERTIPVHPRCACRAPRGNDSEPDPRPATSPVGTTSP